MTTKKATADPLRDDNKKAIADSLRDDKQKGGSEDKQKG
jgi:hypothetical protein